MAMHSLRDPVFKGNFRVFVGPFSLVERYLRARDLWTDDLGTPKAAKALSIEKDGCQEILLWFPETFTGRTIEDQALLAHEALHATVWTLRNRGVPDAAILDEAGTYYLEWLLREVMRCLRR